MKNIILVRHGKSSWEYDVSDRERPLKSRGVKDAQLVANQFIQSHTLPTHFFSSPAKRAFETCKIFMKTFQVPLKDVEISEDLYDFGGRNVEQFFMNLPNSIDRVMIFGHNYAFTNIANTYGNRPLENLPTSGLVSIELNISSWRNLKQGITKLLLIPKELR